MEKDKLTNLLKFDDFIESSTRIMTENVMYSYAVVSTDISSFKFFNYRFGYSMGDVLLKNLADFFVNHPQCVCAGRPYTDHAAGLFDITGMSRSDFEDRLAEDIKNFVLNQKCTFPDAPLHLNTGVTYASFGESMTALLDRANIARRSEKGNYSIPFVVYSEKLQKKKDAEERILPIFDKSLAKGTIPIYLQPKVSAETQQIVGAEALTRLIDEGGNIVSPDEFIQVLESSGKILDLDWYVMKGIFAKVRRWLDEGKDVKPISINLSKIHFFHPTIVEDIITEFNKHNIPAELIEFEVTESVFFEESNLLIDRIEGLRKRGFKVSVDDFGAGYSSLNLIGTLPVDIIKLDKGFIKNCLGNSRGQNIIKGLIGILNEIDMDIVCEGIETKDEERVVYEFGCDSMQGFLYDKPIPIDKFEKKYL